MFEEITQQARQALLELLDAAGLKAGDLLVIGCSSSEVVGERIGKGSSMEAAQAVFAGVYPVLKERGIYLAAQCCEHLNRALILEQAADECADHAEIRLKAGPEGKGLVLVKEVRQFRFEFEVKVERSVEEARTRAARSVFSTTFSSSMRLKL